MLCGVAGLECRSYMVIFFVHAGTGEDARRPTPIFFLHQLESLEHAESVLLVYDYQAEFRKFDFLLDQGMCSDYQLGISL